MHLRKPNEEPEVLKDSGSTLSDAQPYSASFSTALVAGFEAVVVSTSTRRWCVESVVHREYSCEVVKVDRAVTASLEPLREFPELVPLVEKLAGGRPLDEASEAGLSELAKATGWSVEDVVDDLRGVGRDPLDRVDRYRSMFEKYYGEALKLVGEDDQQAAEKLWGAVTALVKLHASLKRVFVAVWDHSKLYNYVTHNVEEEHRELFYDLLKTGEVLHRHFYEGGLDKETFNAFWARALKLLDEAKRVVYKLYAKAV